MEIKFLIQFSLFFMLKLFLTWELALKEPKLKIDGAKLQFHVLSN